MYDAQESSALCTLNHSSVDLLLMMLFSGTRAVPTHPPSVSGHTVTVSDDLRNQIS